ncbi:Hypothetical_protein [Hexamita inflata]|uniref:Hypothetical_protein n=1 Tax=Hexamita inflata TaxID=28002 RepID=A0AA86P6M1_9EUKA|nr:Hypothetical protein HINF_LOCUS4967 [Hexamita inflata]CAI9931157.1 Hypothetical protein HINF_LOCUS18802 [Hexamita inflata]
MNITDLDMPNCALCKSQENGSKSKSIEESLGKSQNALDAQLNNVSQRIQALKQKYGDSQSSSKQSPVKNDFDFLINESPDTSVLDLKVKPVFVPVKNQFDLDKSDLVRSHSLVKSEVNPQIIEIKQVETKEVKQIIKEIEKNEETKAEIKPIEVKMVEKSKVIEIKEKEANPLIIETNFKCGKIQIITHLKHQQNDAQKWTLQNSGNFKFVVDGRVTVSQDHKIVEVIPGVFENQV